MKVFIMTIVFAVCGIVVAGYSHNPEIQDGLLLRWPMDFKGEAVIPTEIKHIGSEAFSGCRDLTSVVFPESLETIGSFAFAGCDRLCAARIPAAVTNIGGSAFFNCQALTNLVVLATIGKIPRNMCSFCCGLRHVELPNGLAEVGDMAFRGCRSLQSIGIPSSVRRIGRGTFIGCSRLSGVELPKGMELIDGFAFYGCYDLRRLVLHSVPAEIGAGAFRDCHNLKGYVVADGFRTNTLYSVPSDREISVANIGDAERLVGNYETVDVALLAADKIGDAEPERGMFKGLEQVLRIAADGMVDEMSDKCYPVGKIDALAANLFRLSEQDGAQAIKDYFKSYSAASVDVGDKLIANLSIEDDIAITVWFRDENLIKIALSDGLKEVARRKLKKEDGVVDESALKWLK